MDVLAVQISPVWLTGGWLVALGLVLLIARRATWRMLADPANMNVFVAASLMVLGIWLIRTGVKPGLSFHLLGSSMLTLMFRPLFALLAIALVVCGLGASNGQWGAIPVNWLLLGAVPVAVTWVIHAAAQRWLPRHLFVYLFLNAFLGAGMAMLSVGLVSASFHYLAGVYPSQYLASEYLPYFLLMGWSEAFITGMLATVLVVWRPDWVATFQDSQYLARV